MSTRYHSQAIHYLGTSYGNPDPAARQFRYCVVTLLAFRFFKEGKLADSSITHNIPLDALGMHGDWLTW